MATCKNCGAYAPKLISPDHRQTQEEWSQALDAWISRPCCQEAAEWLRSPAGERLLGVKPEAVGAVRR